MVGEGRDPAQLQSLVGVIRGRRPLQLVRGGETEKVVDAGGAELGWRRQARGLARDLSAAWAQARREKWLFGQAAAADGRADQGEVAHIGDRDLQPRDIGVEWTDHAQHKRVRGQRLDVALTLRGVVQPGDGIIARHHLDGEAVDGRMLVHEELHTIERRRAGASLGSGQRQVDADPDDLGRGPAKARAGADHAHRRCERISSPSPRQHCEIVAARQCPTSRHSL